MLQVINPATGKLVREVAAATTDDIDRVMERSETAYRAWRHTTFNERAKVLRDVAQYMRDHIETLAPLMTEEMGKPKKEALGEVTKAAWCADHYAAHAESYLANDELASDASHSYVRYLPLGPVLGVLPWNAPFWLAFRFCAPALMAGNTCVMKHDPHVPACAEAIAELFDQVGAPANIMQNLPLATPDVAQAIDDKRIRGVSFTGSDRAGAKVASMAAAAIKPAVLELGGSDPVIVLADANLDEAADAITTSRIINAGQSCIAAKRIIVEAPVYDDFLARLEQRLRKLTLGDPAREDTDVGPIARDDLRQNLHRQVTETIEQGARCVIGGEMPDGAGYYYPVTLLADVEPHMTAACEETFGPVAVVLKAENADQALTIANDTEYGLAASIWTTAERGEMLSLQMEAGQVVVNGLVKTDPRLPSGGIKRSGYGRELGPHGIHAFVNAQQVWIGPKQD